MGYGRVSTRSAIFLGIGPQWHGWHRLASVGIGIGVVGISGLTRRRYFGCVVVVELKPLWARPRVLEWAQKKGPVWGPWVVGCELSTVVV